jgi:hypothetical protein
VTGTDHSPDTIPPSVTALPERLRKRIDERERKRRDENERKRREENERKKRDERERLKRTKEEAVVEQRREYQRNYICTYVEPQWPCNRCKGRVQKSIYYYRKLILISVD